jgi:hypothetical protein
MNKEPKPQRVDQQTHETRMDRRLRRRLREARGGPDRYVSRGV